MADDFGEKTGQEENPGRKKRPGLKIAAACVCLLAAAAVFYSTGADNGTQPAPVTAAPEILEGVSLAGVTALAVSADGKYMLSGSASGLLRVWDIYAGKQLQAWKAGDEPVRAAAFSEDAGLLAAAAGQAVHVWDRRARTELFTIEAGAALTALEYGAGGSLAGLLENGELRFWDAAGKTLRSAAVAGASGGAAVLGAGRLLYEDKGSAALVDTASGGEIRRFSFDGASALALNAGGLSAAAGGGAVGVWDASGAPAGGIKNTRAASSLALSADGTKVLLGADDGTVYMIDIATGGEIARYAGFGETEEDNEWVCITAAGYYVTSKKGSALLTVQAAGETFTMDQFREALHRPDLVAKALRGEKPETPRQESEKEELKDGVSLASLLREADKLPVIEIVGPAQRTSSGASEKVQVRITDRGQGAERVMIYDEGNLCHGLFNLSEVMTGRREEKGGVVYDAALSLDLKPGRNLISVSVFGGREHGAPESKKAKIEVTTSWQPPAPVESRPTLHVFTAAIQNYAGAGEDLNKLKYTKADAQALQDALARQGTTGKRYAKVEPYELYDADVTKEGLARKFDEVKPLVNENDTFVFFFSGHGDVDVYKDFYFLPADAEGWTIAAERNILKQDLLGNLLKIKARNIFVMLDTCHAGALEDTTSAIDRAWGDLAQKVNLAILMAAAGNQYAIESPEDEQGVLTWTVLQGLKGNAPRREERYVAVTEMLEYVRRQAPIKAGQVVAQAVSVAVRGQVDLSSYVQEPVPKLPEKNFDLFDLKWRPAKVTVKAETAGELTVKGPGPEQRHTLAAKRPVTLTLREDGYEFTMRYRAEVAPETISREIYNETEETIAFTGVPEVKRPITPPEGFVYVSPGAFTMGSPVSEEGRSDNEVQHRVNVSGFFMGKYEVTQREYAALMRANPSGFRGDNKPVEKVSWLDAVRYCNERSRREGLAPAYTVNGSAVTWNRAANGYRLPTEAEWEYACRAGGAGPFSVSRANFNKNSRRGGAETNTVGSADPNRWGLYDTHGNVWEWCWDWFGNYRTGDQTDPTGPASGATRVTRGGCYYSANAQLRAAHRGSSLPEHTDVSLGFRLARSLPAQTAGGGR
ncbi:MAG: SUMF1/EgtB/PvdO family nonheme iron enzyme [Spirochaetales bacterium]|jgi:formylglycine-generating enzyme required for sulfatase activity|nr:SUMF1/EgtB/PvdO family nonheme iron enzyme [Spirochaetales bacterium]